MSFGFLFREGYKYIWVGLRTVRTYFILWTAFIALCHTSFASGHSYSTTKTTTMEQWCDNILLTTDSYKASNLSCYSITSRNARNVHNCIKHWCCSKFDEMHVLLHGKLLAYMVLSKRNQGNCPLDCIKLTCLTFRLQKVFPLMLFSVGNSKEFEFLQ